MNPYTTNYPSVPPTFFSDRIWQWVRSWLIPSEAPKIQVPPFPWVTSDPVVPLEGEAVVDQPIYPYSVGRVYYQGGWWLATCMEDAPLLTNQGVRVVARQNVTLLVTAIASPLETKRHQ